LLKLIFKRKEEEVEDDDDNDEKKTQGFSLWKAIYLTLLNPKCWIHFQWSSSSSISSSIRRSLAPQRGGHVAFFNSGFGDNTLSVHTRSKEHTTDVSKPPNFLLCSIESPQN
jgi:hypothetical protein